MSKNAIKTKAILSFIGFLLLFNIKFISAQTLNLYGTLTSQNGIVNPIGVTTDNTYVYVADYGANKIYKINSSLNVTTFAEVNKPIAIAYASNKIAVATESEGGKIYDTSGNLLATFGTGFTGSESYKNIIKPADMAIGPDNYIYVTDASDRYIKTYTLTGSFVSLVGNGTFPFYDPSQSYGNGQFYIPSGIAFDSATNKMLVADFGNYTPYFQLTLKWNPFKRQYDRVTSYAGKPKGKVQIFVNPGTGYSCDPGVTGARQYIIHGTNPANGEVITATSIITDSNYLYLIDSLGKKLFIFANAAIDSKVQTTSSGSYTYPVGVPVNADPVSSPAGYTIFYNAYDFNSLNVLAQLRDIVKFGTNTLVVTDSTGKIYFFTIS